MNRGRRSRLGPHLLDHLLLPNQLFVRDLEQTGLHVTCDMEQWHVLPLQTFLFVLLYHLISLVLPGLIASDLVKLRNIGVLLFRCWLACGILMPASRMLLNLLSVLFLGEVQVFAQA